MALERLPLAQHMLNAPPFLARKLARLCEKYLQHYNGFSYDFTKGGEQNVLQRLSTLDFATIFDVGANVGRWTQRAAHYFPHATFHTFELSRATYNNLITNLVGPHFKNNNVGLSDTNATVTYKDYGINSGLNTILANADFHDKRIAPTFCEAQVMTGDSYCDRNGITDIDFLKLDVEGAEHMVLGGFRRFLSLKKIRCIQFEYGYTHGDARFLMRDFYRLFHAIGYIIAKVRPAKLAFVEFDYTLNDFTSGPNYLAVSADDAEIRAALTQ